MVLQNHQKLIEMTSNIFNTIAFGVGFKCPRKIHLNTQCPVKVYKKIVKFSFKQQKIFWVLAFSFMYLVSVDPMNRSQFS